MSAAAIQVTDLVKVYRVPEREAGLAASIRSLVRRTYREVRAVDQISFEIAPHEVVGFLGPNGAGKTTTLKVLSGLLHPTRGTVQALGHVPSRRSRDYLRRMALVMGHRNQLQWDLPVKDSYELHRAIYQIPWPEFRRTQAELVDVLGVGDLLRKPVRNLSLGERMKVELAGALLHRPEVLFLDEPTLGMDAATQKRIREFVAEYNRRYGASVLLTSHYMADVVALCERVIMIHHGQVVFDGALSQLSAQVAEYKELVVTLAGAGVDLEMYGEVVNRTDDRVTLRVPRTQASAVTARLLADHAVLDLTVSDPPIDDMVEAFLAQRSGV